MTLEEKQLFISFLFDHKHLWLTFQEYRYLTEHPEMDWETVHARFCEEVDSVYQSLADALLEEKPLQDTLETVLLNSSLTQAEVQNWMKKRDE